VVGGRPLARLHSCEGRSPSLVLVQIRRIWFAGTSLRSLATWPDRPSLRLRTMYETSNRPVRLRTSSLDTILQSLMEHCDYTHFTLCLQPLTCHCKAKPEIPCYSSTCPAPPNHHRTTLSPADNCSLSLTVPANTCPGRNKTCRCKVINGKLTNC